MQRSETQMRTRRAGREGFVRRLAAHGFVWALLLLLSLGSMSFALVRMAAAQHIPPSSVLSVEHGLNLSVGAAPSVAASTAYVLDADTGAVYYAKDADAERPMASTTKIMTALVALEKGNLDQ